MTREEAIRILHEALPGLRERFAVLDLAIFGSVARDEAGPDSDIDILVTLDDKASVFKIMDLQFHLEDLLGLKVDLATPRALRPRIRPSVERDLIHVA